MTTATASDLKVTAIVPWYGSNRMLAHRAGELLSGCEWVGIPFAGGMCEVAYIKARTILVNDIHRHVVNLAATVKMSVGSHRISTEAEALPFHPDTLREAQERCQTPPRDPAVEPFGPDTTAALWYFVSQWMGRSGIAGTDREFTGKLPIRWNAGGGDSNVRYRSAVESIPVWHRIMQRCNFSTLDFREFLSNCKDLPKHGIYCDPPFPAGGEKYRHTFTEQDHRDLAKILSCYDSAKVVLRYYDHPLVAELYPESEWTWLRLDGRKQTNEAAPEVLITRG